MKAASRPAVKNPFGFGQLLSAMYVYLKKSPREIIIIQTPIEEAPYKMSSWLHKQFLPDGISIIVNDKLQLEKLAKYPIFMGRNFLNSISGNKSEIAYVCKNFTCSLPINSLEELQRSIGAF
jgi:uncharacterized protein YyaL (SSP411 family)